MKKFYLDDNECNDYLDLFVKYNSLSMLMRMLIKELCLLNYPAETLTTPIFKTLMAKTIEAEKNMITKEDEILKKYCKHDQTISYNVNPVAGTLIVRSKNDPKITRDVITDVEEKYSYMVQRHHFIVGREIDNIVFLITQHFNDDNDDFLNSDIMKKRIEKLIEAETQRHRYEAGVAAILFDNNAVESSRYISYSKFCDLVRVIV